jgi:hypothetical protein
MEMSFSTAPGKKSGKLTTFPLYNLALTLRFELTIPNKYVKCTLEESKREEAREREI